MYNISLSKLLGRSRVLLLLMLMLPLAMPAAAQQPPDEPVRLSSAEGDSVIVSQAVTVSEFAENGTLDHLTATAAGLQLSEGATEGIYTSPPIQSPLDFTTDVGLTWQAELPAEATLSMAVRLSTDGTTWGEWTELPVELYPTPEGAYAGRLIWVDQGSAYGQLRATFEAAPNGDSPRLTQITALFSDTSQGPSTAGAVAAAEAASSTTQDCLTKPLVISRRSWGAPMGKTAPTGHRAIKRLRI